MYFISVKALYLHFCRYFKLHSYNLFLNIFLCVPLRQWLVIWFYDQHMMRKWDLSFWSLLKFFWNQLCCCLQNKYLKVKASRARQIAVRRGYRPETSSVTLLYEKQSQTKEERVDYSIHFSPSRGKFFLSFLPYTCTHQNKVSK